MRTAMPNVLFETACPKHHPEHHAKTIRRESKPVLGSQPAGCERAKLPGQPSDGASPVPGAPPQAADAFPGNPLRRVWPLPDNPGLSVPDWPRREAHWLRPSPDLIQLCPGPTKPTSPAGGVRMHSRRWRAVQAVIVGSPPLTWTAVLRCHIPPLSTNISATLAGDFSTFFEIAGFFWHMRRNRGARGGAFHI